AVEAARREHLSVGRPGHRPDRVLVTAEDASRRAAAPRVDGDRLHRRPVAPGRGVELEPRERRGRVAVDGAPRLAEDEGVALGLDVGEAVGGELALDTGAVVEREVDGGERGERDGDAEGGGAAYAPAALGGGEAGVEEGAVGGGQHRRRALAPAARLV